MYKLTEKCEVNLQPKVTPKTLKGLKSLGLLSAQVGSDEVQIITDIFTDENKLRQFCNLVFVIDTEIDYDEIDIAELLGGYRDFFLKLVPKPN